MLSFDATSYTVAACLVLSGLLWHSRHHVAFLMLSGCAKVRAACTRPFQPMLVIDDTSASRADAAHDAVAACPPLFPCVSDIQMFDRSMAACDHAVIRLGLLQCTISVQGTTAHDSCALWALLHQQWIEYGQQLGMWRRWLLGYHEQQFPAKIVVEFNSTLLSITASPLLIETQRDNAGQRAITITPETVHVVYPTGP